MEALLVVPNATKLLLAWGASWRRRALPKTPCHADAVTPAPRLRNQQLSFIVFSEELPVVLSQED